VTARPPPQTSVKPWDPRGAGLRRLAYVGSRFGPRPWLKHSPSLFGLAFGLAMRKERQAVRLNLRRLFGPRPTLLEERDILSTFVAYAHCLAESLGSERKDARSARCEVPGSAELDELVKSDSGFIIGTAHTGGWDVAAQCLMAQSGRKVVLVMDREPDERARALQDLLRGKRGIEVAHVGADALEGLALLRHLKQGGVVAVQLGRSPKGSRNVEVQLGRWPFRVPLGPFVLASLARVPILPLFVARRGYYQYFVQVEPAVRLARCLSSGEAEAAAQRVARQLEAFLLDNPEQWFNFDVVDAEPPATSAP
jgi:phosphatidylinositol dimannoside acyltransferase